ncbi:MAG: linear amide C-N hydrolase [Methyloceanibacter sp.]
MCSRLLWCSVGHPVLVGRNWDWTDVVITELYTTPKGIERSGMTPTNPMRWRAKYASVAAVAWEAVTGGGINEAGLSVNVLYLAESDFGDRDDARKGVCCSVWAQYYLDSFATVAEAVEAAKSIQVVPFKVVHKGELGESTVHMEVADASGDSAIIEILDGKPVIHHGKQYKVMTNSPTYDEQLALLKEYEGLGGSKPVPGGSQSDDRFVRGAYYAQMLPENPATYQAAVAGVLSIMRNMSTPFGMEDPDKPNISATRWRTIADLTNKRYYFEFADMPNVVWVDMDKLNLDEGASVQKFNLETHADASGQVADKFHPTEPPAFTEAGVQVN